MIEPIEGQYNLSNGTYTVTIERLGSSTQASGYALVNVANAPYSTSKLNPDEAFSFTIEVKGNASLLVKSMWGEPVGLENELILKDTVVEVLGETSKEKENLQMEKDEENRQYAYRMRHSKEGLFLKDDE